MLYLKMLYVICEDETWDMDVQNTKALFGYS
jgi:hypothetical protein